MTNCRAGRKRPGDADGCSRKRLIEIAKRQIAVISGKDNLTVRTLIVINCSGRSARQTSACYGDVTVDGERA